MVGDDGCPGLNLACAESNLTLNQVVTKHKMTIQTK